MKYDVNNHKVEICQACKGTGLMNSMYGSVGDTTCNKCEGFGRIVIEVNYKESTEDWLVTRKSTLRERRLSEFEDLGGIS